MEAKKTMNFPLRDLLTKKPFTRVMPDGRYDHGDRWNEVTEEPPVYDYLRRKIVTQEDFARELDPCGHIINDREYYPDVWRQNTVDGLWYLEEVPRYAFAYQQVILHNQLTHLTGNDIQFELADKSEDDNARKIYNAFKSGWADKNMEVAWYQFAKSVKATGDAAFVGYMDHGEFGWKVLSFLNGDKLYPHYDLKTGKLNAFARTYSNYSETGRVTKKFVDVWDDTYYYRFSAAGEGGSVIDRFKNAIMNLWNVNGYSLEYVEEHNFEIGIPVAYQRDDYGACWTFSQESIDNYEMAFSRLAQNNHDFGLPIMYVKGEGSQEVTKKDMSYASKIFILPSDGEIGFLNRQDASNAYKTELDILENKIYEQSHVVKTPELKSGDLPAAAIKLLYTPAYNKAMSDSNEYAVSIDTIIEIFKFGYGVEAKMRLDFKNTKISHYIKPYIHLNETELTTNLASQVQNGFLSKQTASEKSPYSTPQEWDRILKEKKREQEQELLLQQQKLEIQSDIAVEEAERMAEIEAQYTSETSTTDGTTTTTKQARKVRGHKGSIAKGHGRTADGTYSKEGYDRWGNKEGRNNWDNWNRSH